MFDYLRTRATADRLIERFGQAGKLVVPGAPSGEPYDPDPGAPVEHPALFVVQDYSNREVDGTRIQLTDKRVLLSAAVAVEPANNHTLVESDGRVYRIVTVNLLKPADTVVAYDVQVRR